MSFFDKEYEQSQEGGKCVVGDKKLKPRDYGKLKEGPPSIDFDEFRVALHFFRMQDNHNNQWRFEKLGGIAEHMYNMVNNAIRVATARYEMHRDFGSAVGTVVGNAFSI